MKLLKKIIIPPDQRKRTTLASTINYDLLEIYEDSVIGYYEGQQIMTWYFENFIGIDFIKANMNSQFAQVVFLTGINSKNRAIGLDLFSTQNINAINDSNRILLCSGMFSFSKTNDFAKEIANNIRVTYDNFKQIPKKSDITISAADEIVKFKQLFDEGIITKDEFEIKKKQLLGL